MTKSNTDLQDLSTRLDANDADLARGERMDLETLSGAAHQWAMDGLELLMGYPGRDGTEWRAKSLLGGTLNDLNYNMTQTEEKWLPNAIRWADRCEAVAEKSKIERDRSEERASYDSRGNEYIQQSQSHNSTDHNGLSVTPDDNLEMAIVQLENTQAEYDAMQVVFHAVENVYAQNFGAWEKRGAKPEMKTTSSSPRLAALKARASTIIKDTSASETKTQRLNRMIQQAAAEIEKKLG